MNADEMYAASKRCAAAAEASANGNFADAKQILLIIIGTVITVLWASRAKLE